MSTPFYNAPQGLRFDGDLTRIIHDVRLRLWRGSRGEAVFEYCEPRMTKPEAEDDIAFGEETMDAYIVRGIHSVTMIC
jgi:hypothetical protein